MIPRIDDKGEGQQDVEQIDQGVDSGGELRAVPDRDDQVGTDQVSQLGSEDVEVGARCSQHENADVALLIGGEGVVVQGTVDDHVRVNAWLSR